LTFARWGRGVCAPGCCIPNRCAAPAPLRSAISGWEANGCSGCTHVKLSPRVQAVRSGTFSFELPSAAVRCANAGVGCVWLCAAPSGGVAHQFACRSFPILPAWVARAPLHRTTRIANGKLEPRRSAGCILTRPRGPAAPRQRLSLVGGPSSTDPYTSSCTSILIDLGLLGGPRSRESTMVDLFEGRGCKAHRVLEAAQAGLHLRA